MKFTPQQLEEASTKSGVGSDYLYQCTTGRRDMKPKLAVHVEASTDGLLRRWHLRIKDWHLIWPELVGSPGAPKPPSLKPPMSGSCAVAP